MNPFLKWAGGKRWIVNRPEFRIPKYTGRYVEPFLGGGAVFFHLNPKQAILSDVNPRLIETYEAIKSDWQMVVDKLSQHQMKHSDEYYYQIRSEQGHDIYSRAAQLIYLNRTCWNGLYRENQRGQFNVPKGTKDKVIIFGEDFSKISQRLQCASIVCRDFEATLDLAQAGDFAFVDPPYTTAHNKNGFVRYNEGIFTWGDQIRLRDAIVRATGRGVSVLVTNADHDSVRDLYSSYADLLSVERASVISGGQKGRGRTTELLIACEGEGS